MEPDLNGVRNRDVSMHFRELGKACHYYVPAMWAMAHILYSVQSIAPRSAAVDADPPG